MRPPRIIAIITTITVRTLVRFSKLSQQFSVLDPNRHKYSDKHSDCAWTHHPVVSGVCDEERQAGTGAGAL